MKKSGRQECPNKKISIGKAHYSSPKEFFPDALSIMRPGFDDVQNMEVPAGSPSGRQPVSSLAVIWQLRTRFQFFFLIFRRRKTGSFHHGP
jgi:hypothetical protein